MYGKPYLSSVIFKLCFFSQFKNSEFFGAGEKALQLRTQFALPENPSSAPSNHVRWLTVPGESYALDNLGTHHPSTHIDMIKNKE